MLTLKIFHIFLYCFLLLYTVVNVITMLYTLVNVYWGECYKHNNFRKYNSAKIIFCAYKKN